MARFSIISLNWNGRKYLGNLLNKHILSLLNADHDDFEIIFADNGSTDDSIEYIRAHFDDDRIKVLQLKRNYGYAKGNNLALKAINPAADIIVFINTDTVVDRRWLKGLEEAFSDPRVAIAQPLLLDLDNGFVQFMGGYADQWGRSMTIGSGGDEKINKLLQSIIKMYKNAPLQVMWAYGACIAVRRAFLDRIGGFNELFRFSLEEQTLCIPANRLGYKVVVVPKSTVYHKSGATIKHLKLTTEHICNRFLYILLYYPFPMIVKSLLGRTLLELFLSLSHPIALFKALSILLKNVKLIFSHRRKTYMLPYDSPLLIRTPLVLTKKKHVELVLKKLIEVNRKV
jgi:GT2 family glycosyltransferase